MFNYKYHVVLLHTYLIFKKNEQNKIETSRKTSKYIYKKKKKKTYHVGDLTKSIGTPLVHRAQSVSIHFGSPEGVSSPPPPSLAGDGDEGERGEGEGEEEWGEEVWGDLGEEDWRAKSMVAEVSSSGGLLLFLEDVERLFELFLFAGALLDLRRVEVVVVLLASIGEERRVGM